MTLMGWWRRRCGPTQSTKETGHLYQIVAGFSAAICVMASGTCFGWATTNLLLLLSPESPVPMTFSQASWMIALLEVGNLITPIPAGLLADAYGRKPLILAAGPIYILSWFIIYKAQTISILCSARILQSCAIGIVYTVVPMYLGEITSPKFRGAITSIFQSALVAGYLLEYCVGPLVSYGTLTIVNGLLPVIFMICFITQPETPYFFLMKDKEKEAAKSLAYLRGKKNPEEVLEELSAITESVKREMSDQASWKDVVGTSTDRQALLIVNVVGIVKVLGGSIAIPTYCTQFFSQVGFDGVSPNTLTLILGLLAFACGFFSTALSDIAGRRPLLMISCVGCAFNLLTVAGYFYSKDVMLWNVGSFNWVCCIVLILYTLFLSFGLDPVSITYRAEMFPANTRSLASSINSVAITLCSFMSLKLYQVISDGIGIYAIYLVFSLVSFCGAFWLYFNAIETKGKTLSEVQLEIQNSVQMRRKQKIIKGKDNYTTKSTIDI